MPKALMLVLLFSLLCIPGRPGTCRAETAVIPVHYRSVAEVLPIVEGLLTPTGKVTFVDRVHSLVVTDSAESIQNVRNFLETFDTPPQQVRIRVKFDEQMNSGRRRIAGRGRVSGDEWSLSTGGKTEDGVDIRANDRKQGQQQTSEYVIVTMEIVPFIAGNRATIEITPRISRVQEGDPKGVIRFTESSTRLSVPLGQWVEIGGTNQAGKEVLSAILKSGSSKESSVLVMRIMVETF
jgi:type II secretory pathway component GspD/PulD (secretin)